MSVAVVVVSWLSIVAAIPVLLIASYLLFLVLLSRTRAPRVSPTPTTRFAFVVPAHNEQVGIEQTVRSLLAVDYPETARRVVVVADNCQDRTAELARASGAHVIERTDTVKRGKGYALERAFGELLADETVDAVVVVDADTLVSPNILRAFDQRIVDGEHAMQADYGVSNVDASWRTRLMTIALSVFHGVRSLGRERLSLSTGLRGNGMCFTRTLLLAHPHTAYGLVEDVEYGIAIGRGGHRVAYVHEASVKGEMVTTGKSAASQRRRWEGGRRALVRAHLGPLLADAFTKPSLLALDLAIDLLIPPLSTLVLAVLVGVAVEVALVVVVGVPSIGLGLWSASLLALTLYVARGVWLSPLGARGFLVLWWAPVYVVWKLVAARPTRDRTTWVRTTREGEGTPTDGAGSGGSGAA